MKTLALITSALTFWVLGCSNPYERDNPMDPYVVNKKAGSVQYEGQTYKTLVIGTKVWMAKNLNYNATGSKCYDNLESNCTKYGRLYNWATAMTACPEGWHLPTHAEWTALANLAGGEETAGKKLKATTGWNSNGNGTDDYGFSALPGGSGNSNGSSFYDVGSTGSWWTATESDASSAYTRDIYYNDDGVGAFWYGYGKSNLYSVRCVKDN
jgi:uncharacterized protein (TIGR02145 family)